MRTYRLTGLIAVWCCLCGTAAHAQSEFRLPFDVLEHILATQAFTPDGRLYLRGNSSAVCNYAYLQDPKLSSVDGKLKLNARFSGRSAINFFGQCVGFGNTFGLTILSTPYYKDGSLRFRDVSASCEAYGIYARAACLSIARSLEVDFRHDLRTAAERLLEGSCAGKPPYRTTLEAFNVTAIRVTNDGVILSLELGLALK
jgi:hypothetical protein